MLFFPCLWMNVTKTGEKRKLISLEWKKHPVKSSERTTVILPYERTDFYNYRERTYRKCILKIRNYEIF